MADHVLEHRPDHAARVLERLGLDETVRLLSRGGAESACALLPHLSPQFAGQVLERLDPERAARIVDALDLDLAGRLVRRLPPAARQALLEQINRSRKRAIEALLRFPENSAGALMDPEVLALPFHLNAREALARIRASAANARYNVYVVDDEQKLVGVLNLRELLQARPRTRLSDLMVRDPKRLLASNDRAAVLSHIGWKEVHALPVVDESGAYLGALRYRTLRELEKGLLSGRPNDAEASAALGSLLAAGAGALLDALSSGSPERGPAGA
jgi:magnesium transporter